VKIKGVAIRGTIRAVEKLHGKDAVERVRAVLPARLRDPIDKATTLEWYPVELSATLHAAVRDVLGNGTWDVSHALGREAARADFSGIYRTLMRAVQYDTVWDRMERAWQQYASAGDVAWYERGRGNAKAYISGVGGYNGGMWNSIAGRCEEMLHMSGARGASVVMVDPANTHCHFEALWLE
jgi:hypothetical protein